VQQCCHKDDWVARSSTFVNILRCSISKGHAQFIEACETAQRMCRTCKVLNQQRYAAKLNHCSGIMARLELG